MTVQEMIDALSIIEDKSKPIKEYHQNRPAYELSLDIDGIADNEEEVLIGNNLPSEVFEKDYKYERGCV